MIHWKFSRICQILLFFTIPIILQAVTVYDIQFTEDVSGKSLLCGETVNVSGVITAFGYRSGSNSNRFFLSDPEGGAWHGVFCYNSDYVVSVGDMVAFTAEVEEYSDFTELNNITNLTILSTGNEVPEPIDVSTQLLATEEQYEGCLVKVSGVTATATPDGFGQWYVDDGSGVCQIDDQLFGLDAVSIGDEYFSIVGAVDFSYNEFGLNPRNAADFGTGGFPEILEITTQPEIPIVANDVIISALIRDNDGQVVDVELSWRVIMEETGDWQSDEMTVEGDDLFAYTLTGLNSTIYYYEYFITVLDDDGLEVSSDIMIIRFNDPSINLIDIFLGNQPQTDDSLLVNVVLQDPLNANLEAWLLYSKDYHSAEYLAKLIVSEQGQYHGWLPAQKEGTTLKIGVYAVNDILEVYYYNQIYYTFPVESHQAILKVSPHPVDPLIDFIEIEYFAQTGDSAILRIYNAEGKLMLTPQKIEVSSPSGYNNYNWDGRDRNGNLLPWGLYICHLEVKEKDSGNVKTARVPIVIGAKM